MAGTDSALRKETTDPVLSIDMEPAERFDILITFNLIEDDYIFLKSKDEVLFTIELIGHSTEIKRPLPQPSFPKVPFVDLSELPSSAISRRRMRIATMQASNGIGFGINGHLKYHEGSSEDP